MKNLQKNQKISLKISFLFCIPRLALRISKLILKNLQRFYLKTSKFYLNFDIDSVQIQKRKIAKNSSQE